MQSSVSRDGPFPQPPRDSLSRLIAFEPEKNLRPAGAV